MTELVARFGLAVFVLAVVVAVLVSPWFIPLVAAVPPVMVMILTLIRNAP